MQRRPTRSPSLSSSATSPRRSTTAFSRRRTCASSWRQRTAAPRRRMSLKRHIEKPGDKIRQYLAGDILPALASLFERAKEIGGTVHLALYELDDRELVDLLAVNQERLQLILTTAGSRPVRARNARAAAALAMRAPARKIAKKKAAARKAKQAAPKRRPASRKAAREKGSG